MNSFCANILELRNQDNERFLALSRSAYDNFTLLQRERLSKDKTLLPIAVPTIEAIGGGSVRCMLAEIFLKQNYLPPIIASEAKALVEDATT
jgi:hypothetical protein